MGFFFKETQAVTWSQVEDFILDSDSSKNLSLRFVFKKRKPSPVI
jgi:hypothetical protein